MRRLIEFFIRNHLFGDLLTVMVIGVGLLAIFQIKREVFPNVSFDVITIASFFPGATPEDVEKLVTNPIEQDLKEVDGIKKVQSVSTENQSVLIVTLDPDQTNSTEGKSNIEDVISGLRDYPEGAEPPRITVISVKQQPVIEIALASMESAEDQLTLGEKVKKELENLEGVAKVLIRGERDREFHVEADPAKLARERVSLEEVIAALRRQNLNVPGGNIEATAGDFQSREKFVRTTGEMRGRSEIENTVVRSNDMGRPIRIKDFATVTEALSRAKVLTRTNTKPSINLTVLKKENADAIDVVDEVRAHMTAMQPQLKVGTELHFLNDLSTFIRRRLSILTSNLGLGLLLVLACLPFLIPFRFAVLIALGEPFAFLGTILVMHEFGYSINLISMIGLIIVSGILVDDSIVVTENAVRLMEKGWTPIRAATEGTMQIIGPVTASVMTTTMAFLPMAFMSGIFGKVIFFIPVAVVISLLVSLFETFFILPAHVAHWVRPEHVQNRPAEKRGWLTRAMNRSRIFWDERIVPVYARFLTVSIHHRYLLMLGLTAFIAFSLFIAITSMRVILFPPDGVEIFFIRTEAPSGTSLDNHSRLMEGIEKKVAALPTAELLNFTTFVGLIQQDAHDPFTRWGSEFAQIAIFLTPENERQRTAAEIIEDLRRQIGKPEGFDKVYFARVNPGPPTGKPISLGIHGEEYEDILPASQEIEKLLKGFDGVTDVSNSYVLGKEELRVIVNGEEARAAGLNVDSVGTSVRAAFEGIVATKIRSLNEEKAVRVSFPRKNRESEAALRDISVLSPQGALIPLKNIARIESVKAPLNFDHEKNRREVKITGEVDVDKTSALEVNARIRKMLPDLQAKFPRVGIEFGGEDADTQESLTSLGRAFGFAVLGIFLILVLTFKSLLQPFLVLLTIPLGVVSVIWVFVIHGLPISFLGLLGVVALAGIIVNNAIVFVDFVNQKREGGLSRRESLIEGSKDRLRPIFLTSVTTVVGILPTAYGIGGLDKFVVPIAMALGWGIFFGSILTAFVFPAAIAILDDLTEFREARHARR